MRLINPILLLVCAGLSIWWGLGIGNSVRGGVLDFQAIYYGSRCVLLHSNPYNENEFTRTYLNEAGELPQNTKERKALTLCVNLPTTLLLFAPFALLPWSLARTLWIVFMAVFFVLAAFLIWRSGTRKAPGITLTLVCILLLGSEVLFATGESAGLVIGIAIIAVWSFFNERFVPIGIAFLAIALAIKPHDAGFLWLFFLLAGAVHRKRALYALGVTAAIALAALLWISPVAPNWFSEIRINLAENSQLGGLHEPGFASMTGRTAGMVIDLQAVASAIWSEPHIYNLASYLVCGILICIWVFITLRSRFALENAWMALASVSALTLLITYHRPYDAKLLLLAIPACAILWAEGGITAWLALFVTTAGIVGTGDLFLAVVAHITGHVDVSGGPSVHRTIISVLSQPAPLVLLLTAIFYLWMYIRLSRQRTSPKESDPVTSHLDTARSSSRPQSVDIFQTLPQAAKPERF